MSNKCYFCHSQFANLEAEGKRWIGTKGCGGGICEDCLADGCRELFTEAEGRRGVVVIRERQQGGARILTVLCDGDEDYCERLPKVVEHGGKLFGRFGWSGDNMTATYRSDAVTALEPEKIRKDLP